MRKNTLQNHRILIRDCDTGNIIVDTKIKRFDPTNNIATIDSGSLNEKHFYNVNAFIFAEDGLYDVTGSIRGVVLNNEIEVKLGKSKAKEDRKRTRYQVELEGYVTGICIDETMIDLRTPIQIATINMSANGILLSGDVGLFDIGDVFRVSLSMDHTDVGMVCEIVRIHRTNVLTEEYGCRIREIQTQAGESSDGSK
jgi:hypothetical protein